MKRALLIALASPLIALAAASPLVAQTPETARPAEQAQVTPAPAAPRESRPPADARDQISTTQHSIAVGGTTINYTARSGTMIMRDDDGKPRASVFFTSYTRDAADPARRPLTFTFNGGPGSSSVWLHMGAFGPKRVNYL